jgi:EmrB/QacA subfamily drug resistance transporter
VRSATQRVSYRATFAVLVVGVSAYALLQSLVIPALPTIQASLHTSQSAVTWVVTAYLLSASICTPIIGRIGDMVGKERMLLVTLFALAVGSVVAGVAHSIGVMVVGRAIQGIGGGVLPLSFGIVRDEFPSDKVASGIGFLAAMTAVGGGIGLIIAGPIITSLNYHWLFWIPLIVIIVAAICTKLFVPESPVRTAGSINWLAAALMSGWLVALLLGVSEAPSRGWGSPLVLGLIALAGVGVSAWITVELRSRQPLIDMKMMRATPVWTNNLVSFLFGMGMYSVIAFLPEFLQTPTNQGYGFGASVISSGLYLLPLTAMMFLVGLCSGRIAARFGSKSAVVLGSAVSCGAYVMLAFAHTEPWELYVVSTMLGIGLGLAYSAMSNLIVHAVPPAQTGVASGMNANIRTIGGAMGAAVMSTIVTSTLLHSGYPAETGYTRGFLFLAIVTALAVVAAVFIPSDRRAATSDTRTHISHAELAIIAGGTLTEG